MSDVFVARQPIFNRDLEVVGYELLFRSREAQAIPSPEGATASVVLNAFTEIGLERIVGDRTAWIMDPCNHVWTVATRVEEPTEDERKARLAQIHGKSTPSGA